MRKNEKIDVVIVGTGAAGAVYAALPAEAGKNVLVLEKGRARKPDGLFGEKLLRFMHQGARALGTMVGVCEDPAVEENRIILADKKDKYGMPLAKAAHTVDPESR